MATAEMAASKRRGFTLIELLTALTILVLLFLLGMPSFITFLRNSDIRSTSESLINGLRAASTEATRRNSRVGITLTDANGSWVIRAISDPTTDTNCTGFAPDVIQQFSAAETRTGAKATVTPGGVTSVCFTGLGRVFNQGNNDHIQQIDIARSDGGEGRALRIIVDDPTRGLRMCDPALPSSDPRAC